MNSHIEYVIEKCKDGEYNGADLMALWCYAETASKELEQLRAQNARLTEIAAEKATRMDELYEALAAVVESHDWGSHEEIMDTASEVLYKNNP